VTDRLPTDAFMLLPDRGAPVLTAHLFPTEREALLDLLRSLSQARWAAPTICASWSVKDVALHLLSDADRAPSQAASDPATAWDAAHPVAVADSWRSSLSMRPHRRQPDTGSERK
jgi:hypothetical protein